MCLTWPILIIGFIFVMVTLLRWFEQITAAVDNRQWNQVALFIFMPFAVWLFPSPARLGRETAVPHHEPVRGFGLSTPTPARPAPAADDQPPPGTPPEFLVKPTIPSKPAPKRPSADPEKLAKLQQKMREQGMLDEE
ncbi:MAG TPA: hypothetical protein VF669_04075 [Tepidisphaeraceae bacterium]